LLSCIKCLRLPNRWSFLLYKKFTSCSHLFPYTNAYMCSIFISEQETQINFKEMLKMRNVMERAWSIATVAVRKFGGKVSQYFAEALRMAWNEVKQAANKAEVTIDAD